MDKFAYNAVQMSTNKSVHFWLSSQQDVTAIPTAGVPQHCLALQVGLPLAFSMFKSLKEQKLYAKGEMPRDPVQNVRGNPEWICSQCCVVGACPLVSRASAAQSKEGRAHGDHGKPGQGEVVRGGRLEAGEFWQKRKVFCSSCGLQNRCCHLQTGEDKKTLRGIRQRDLCASNFSSWKEKIPVKSSGDSLS